MPIRQTAEAPINRGAQTDVLARTGNISTILVRRIGTGTNMVLSCGLIAPWQGKGMPGMYNARPFISHRAVATMPGDQD